MFWFASGSKTSEFRSNQRSVDTQRGLYPIVLLPCAASVCWRVGYRCERRRQRRAQPFDAALSLRPFVWEDHKSLTSGSKTSTVSSYWDSQKSHICHIALDLLIGITWVQSFAKSSFSLNLDLTQVRFLSSSAVEPQEVSCQR